MMICPKCNSQVSDDATFCPTCGVPFILDDTPTSEETTVLTADMYPPMQECTVGSISNEQQNTPTMQTPQPTQDEMLRQGTIKQLRTNRSFLKTFLLSLITFGIYALICYGNVTDDVNLVCSRYDGRKSMNWYLLFFVVTPITCGIGSIVWIHNLCDRIGNELKRRQIDYNFGAKDFWLWSIVGALIGIGPIVFAHKFFKAVNKLNESFNQIG